MDVSERPCVPQMLGCFLRPRASCGTGSLECGTRPRASDGSLDYHMVQHLLREANLDFVSAIREVIHVAVLAREVAAAVARRNTGRETLTNDKKKKKQWFRASSWKLNHICCEAKTRSAYMYECKYICIMQQLLFIACVFITNICLSASFETLVLKHVLFKTIPANVLFQRLSSLS